MQALNLSKIVDQVRYGLLALLFSVSVVPISSNASEWEDDSKKSSEETVTSPSSKPLEGRVEKTGDQAMRIQRQNLEPAHLRELTPVTDKGRLEGKAIDDELKGMLRNSPLKFLTPAEEKPRDPLKGTAVLNGGKKADSLDPDADDSELLVEWDRWHNRFLRAVQLGTQEMLNNPDPEDYERPRVDPKTGAIVSSYALGTSAAFSCQVTSDGQIHNLEIISPSGRAKYDRAVLRAVQQLAGTQILNFPKGSHRRTVTQPGRITTATTNQFKYHHFGDVERVRTGN